MQVKLCPSCHADNPPDSLRCTCGAQLTSVATTNKTLFNLPGSLSLHYQLVQPLTSHSSKADLFQIKQHDTLYLLKLYRHGNVLSPELQQRLNNIAPEYRINVLAHGIADGKAYEIMEWCHCGSLRDLSVLAVSWDTLIDKLSLALQHIHAVGLVHRNIKPENILLRSLWPFNLVLSDFQMASVMTATQHHSQVTQSLWYAAPESLSGIIDEKVDYWAFGMILLERWHKRHPFAGLNQAQILHTLSTQQIDLSDITDTNLRLLLQGLLQRDPALRWGSHEITRWQCNKNTLAPSNASQEQRAQHPYNLCNHDCYSKKELAHALSQHWKEGYEDIKSGQISAWLNEELSDSGLCLALPKAYNSDAVRLMAVIHYLDADIPLSWQGEVFDLALISTYVNRAEEGELAATAWLEQCYASKIPHFLATLPQHSLAKLMHGWTQDIDQFMHKLHAFTLCCQTHAPQQAAQYITKHLPNIPHAELLATKLFPKTLTRRQAIACARWQTLKNSLNWLTTVEANMVESCDILTNALADTLAKHLLSPPSDFALQNLQQALDTMRELTHNQLTRLEQLCQQSSFKRQDLININTELQRLRHIALTLEFVAQKSKLAVQQQVYTDDINHLLFSSLQAAVNQLWQHRMHIYRREDLFACAFLFGAVIFTLYLLSGAFIAGLAFVSLSVFMIILLLRNVYRDIQYTRAIQQLSVRLRHRQ